MSLYNMLFGMNPNTEVVLALLGLKTSDIERFRDCTIDYAEKQISIYTRTGGENRDDYPNEALTSNPYYLSDEDDEDDSTYATYYFKFPEELADVIPCLQNVREQGIPAKLIDAIAKTIEREPTEGDKYREAYENQQKLLRDMGSNSYGVEFFTMNGHTVIPLSDRAMERLLGAAEEFDGRFLPYYIRPYNITVEQETPMWKSHPDELCRVKVDTDWKVNWQTWERYVTKFKDKYPKAIARIAEELK